MRYAIAADRLEVSSHFGRCEFYELVDITNGQVTGRQRVANPGHSPGQIPQLMQQWQVGSVVCGGAGPRAQMLLGEKGIGLITGISGLIEEVVAAILGGKLEAGEDACEHTR